MNEHCQVDANINAICPQVGSIINRAAAVKVDGLNDLAPDNRQTITWIDFHIDDIYRH